MEIQYAKLLTLRLRHHYFSDLRCDDWQFSLSVATQQLLNNHRYFWKSKIDAGHSSGIIFAETRTNALPQLPENQPLVIYMKLVKPSFLGNTALDMQSGQQVLVFDNRNAANDDLATGIRKAWLNGFRFQLELPQVLDENAVIQIQNLDSGEIANPKLQAGQMHFSLDPSFVGLNRIDFPAASGLVPAFIYIDEYAKSLGVKGIVLIDPNLNGGIAPASYTIDFQPKSMLWTYFVVLSPANESYSFAIEDAKGEAVFSDITSSIQAGSDIARYRAALAQQAEGAKVFVFQSEAPIALQAKPRPGIRLLRTDLEIPQVVENDCKTPQKGAFVILQVRASEFQLSNT